MKKKILPEVWAKLGKCKDETDFWVREDIYRKHREDLVSEFR